MRQPRFVALVHAGVVLAVATRAGGAATSRPTDDPACENARSAIKVLEKGTFDERWKLADDAVNWIDGLYTNAEDERTSCREAGVVELVEVLRREPDDRIVCRILDADLDVDDAILRAFLPEALRHDSPNVKRRALEALVDKPDDSTIPAIEAIWRHETRPWLRAAALRALGASGDPRFLDEFARVAQSGNPALARLAVVALGANRNPRAAQALEELATHPETGVSDDALETLLRLEPTDAVDDTLLRLAANASPEMASRIVEAVASRGQDAIPLLKSLARARGNDETDPVVAGASKAVTSLEDLADSKSDTMTGHPGMTSLRARGVSVGRILDDGGAGEKTFAAAPPAGSATSRCWEGPGVVDPFSLLPRVPRGELLDVDDSFEWRGEIWYSVTNRDLFCWMPAASLTSEARSPDLGSGLPEEPARAFEVDVPAEDLAGPAARRLLRLRLASILDEDERVAALRIELDPEQREAVLALMRIRALADGQVALAIDQWLWENAKRWDADPEIGPVIPTRDPRYPALDDD